MGRCGPKEGRAQEPPSALRAPHTLTTDRVPISHSAYAVVLQYWQTHKNIFCVGEQHLGWGWLGLQSSSCPWLVTISRSAHWAHCAGDLSSRCWLCPGSLLSAFISPKPTGKGGVCTGFFMMQFAQMFLSVDWMISLLSSPRPLQSPASSAAPLGFALYWTPWCAGLGIHPMSSCPSPTALSILGKSSSSIRSTRGCGIFWR